MTHSLGDVLALLDSVGARPSRALGQHFVIDPNTVRRIVRLAGVEAGDHVVEIGAGLGSLTLALADTGAEVVAIEADRRLVEVLRTEVAGRGVRVVLADATTLDWPSLLTGADRWRLVANLPYNVGTRLVLDVLARAPMVADLFVMVQAEVGERLCAEPGSKVYGIPSVKVAYHATAEIVGRVPATVFYPRPAVESALVHIVRRPPPAVPAAELAALVDAGFAQRRKMLRRSLAGLVDDAAFTRAGVDPTARAETLDLDAWCRLAHARSHRPPRP